jgi:hypothetical protein
MCDKDSDSLQFGEGILSFDRTSFKLTLPHAPFELILR